MEAVARQEKTRTGAPPESSFQTPFRPQPASVDDTGIDYGQLVDLCIKTIHYRGRPSAREICEAMALPFGVLEEVLGYLKREKFIEVIGSIGVGEQQYQYSLSDKGAGKAEETLAGNQYVGATPVPYEDWVKVVHQQSIRNISVDAATVADAMSEMVLNKTTRDLVGPAVNSGRSILLYGDPGNGKSSIAKGIGRMLAGDILIPHAIDVNGQTIRVFDPRVHQKAELPEAPETAPGLLSTTRPDLRLDQRWVVSRRPLIITGGELTMADLELKYSPQSRFYLAPLQIKANGGILVIDDFGRQLVQPKELLNRWIVPMEARVDHLSLLSGETIDIPFELLLVFSTNIPPQELGDEAFFRRIRHKIEVGDPDEESFLRILRGVCEKNGIAFAPENGRYLIDRYYWPKGRNFRGVHPRDIIDLLMDISSFQRRTPEFTPEWIDLACASYFIDDDNQT